MEHITLPNLFFQKAMEKPSEPFLWAKVEGTWESLSWSETEKKVKQLAAGLKPVSYTHLTLPTITEV